MPNNHKCSAEDCSVMVLPSIIFCKECWQKLPQILRDEVWRRHKPMYSLLDQTDPKFWQAHRESVFYLHQLHADRTDILRIK